MSKVGQWLFIVFGILVILGGGVWFFSQRESGSMNTTLATSRTSSSSSQGISLESQLEYEVVEMPVYKGETRLYGQLYRPQVEGKTPLVIFSHELGNTHETGRAYAEYLASRGIATYIFDFSGGSRASQSDGNIRKMSIMTEVADLEAILTSAESWESIDSQEIILMGGSQGGVVSALTASRQEERVKGLILLYPAFVIQDEVHRMFTDLSQVPAESSYLGWFPIGRQYVTDIWDMDFYQEIQSYDKDVLILHGDRDSLVPASYSERAATLYPSAEYHLISGSGHSFLDSNFNQVTDYITDYLESILQVESEPTMNLTSLELRINGQELPLQLEENQTSKELLEALPETLSMNDVNRNEKCVFLDQTFTTEPYYPTRIEKGDVMLYGDNCLVIFYKSFDTTYPYTRIGRLENSENLEELLGSGSVQVEIKS